MQAKAGDIRFNPDTNDFEGFNGAFWVSLTSKSWGGTSIIVENKVSYASDTTTTAFLGSCVAIEGDYAFAS
ncbi:MAG: hypothetical protein AAGK97_10760, partial [Bacteroidota bacterium]